MNGVAGAFAVCHDEGGEQIAMVRMYDNNTPHRGPMTAEERDAERDRVLALLERTK